VCSGDSGHAVWRDTIIEFDDNGRVLRIGGEPWPFKEQDMALDPLTAGMELAGNVINKIWPDKSAQEREQLAAAVALVQGQLDVNKTEAAHTSLFVAGWRPAVGWACASAFAWNWLGLPVAKMAAELAGHSLTLGPADMTEMLPVLMGMLGLGALRTFEKVKGAEGNR
jgi:hypothetical protein